ncbi:hypothetical protein Val02_27850 [Virgisporangium aliadipatigenens]|uniref:Uncharacterized protein n=1 Tax=Virgisporangium aliadipatigenens TaxID=741659 RepID=A0A8J3YIF3_9ACTN|nr:hypothetical protein Val02_27850 [Virgisporangium aliadipatigenens]
MLGLSPRPQRVAEDPTKQDHGTSRLPKGYAYGTATVPADRPSGILPRTVAP